MNGVGSSKQLVSPMMKRVTAGSYHGLIFLFWFLLPSGMFALGHACMCMNYIQPKEAESSFPFCDLGRCPSLFPFISFYFLLSWVCYLLQNLIYLMYDYIQFLTVFFCMIQFLFYVSSCFSYCHALLYTLIVVYFVV